MFYDTLGRLVGQASKALVATAGEAEDPRRAREIRQVATLLRRTGAIWPALFSTLDRECRLLEAAWSEARAALEANGAPLPEARDLDAVEEADRLAYARALEQVLDDVVGTLAERDEPWARGAALALRKRLAEVELLRGELVEAMLEA
jgi:hypothetical protein